MKRFDKQNPYKWVDEWKFIFSKANKYQITETQQNKPVRNFVNTIYYKFFIFSNSYQLKMEKNQQLNMDKIMEYFHKYIENNNNLSNKKNFHSTF